MTSGGKQSVGIHTDITFELSDNKTDEKTTEDDNQEVPIFLGTDTANGRNKFERRHDPNLNRPHFYGTNDDTTGFSGGETGTWVRFFPSTVNEWTTEKYSHSTRKYKSEFIFYVCLLALHFLISYSIGSHIILTILIPHLQIMLAVLALYLMA